MRVSSCWLRNEMACCLIMLLAAPFAEGAPAPWKQVTSGQQPQSASSAQSLPQGSDKQARKPDVDTRKPEVAYPDSPQPMRSQLANQSGQSSAPDSGSDQSQQDSAPKPVGTAAAPYERVTGVAASRPAGAVIAPAKQRRVRSFLIRVGVVVGAAVAVGTVVALSHGSPSRPQ